MECLPQTLNKQREGSINRLFSRKCPVYLKGHNTQHSGHTVYFFQTDIIEIQLVRPTEVCGKV